MKMTALGLLFSASVLSEAAAEATPQPSITTGFGKPTFIHRLYYKKMYSEKPFEQAVLYYYDNGLYKIISPGEEHYGVYVTEGDVSDDTYSISYISLPSSDWGGNVARHDLIFQRDSLTFEQKALAYVDKNIPLQYGTFVLETNTVTNPLTEKWN
jgi:hypothetical protein